MGNIKKFLSEKWILVILLSLPAAWALFVPGFYGASDDMHIGWLYEMDKTISLGQIPPRYVPDLSFGFGYPLFNFVFPLPFYIGELFHLLGLSLVDSIKAVFFISIPLSALSMYFLLKEFTNKWLSMAGALLYVYTPYRAVDLYIRGAIGEIASFVILPLFALSIIKLTANQKLNWRWIGFGAIALSALVLSHNITAFMFLPFVILLAGIRIYFNSKKLIILGKLFLSIFLGLLMSVYFWLPAIVDSSFMKEDTVFNFADHFPTILQLITPYWGYGASVPGPYDGMPFFLGLTNLMVLGLGAISLILFWKRWELDQKQILIWAFISFAISFFMMNYRAFLIWSKIPLLPYFQFPWRFLIMTTFIIPLILVSFEKLKFNKQLSIFLIALPIILNIANFRPQDFLGRDDRYFINRYIPVPTASSEYLTLAEEYLRLPKTAVKRPSQNFALVCPNNGPIKNITQANPLNAKIDVLADQNTIINYNRYFFPGWEAKIDGIKSQIFPGMPFGQISVKVPAGQHLVEIYFQETNFKKILDFLSLLALTVSILFIVKHKFLNKS